MSAIPPKADIAERRRHVRFVPQDHSITSSAATSRPAETVRPSAFAAFRLRVVLILSGRLHREFGGFRTAQNSINVSGGLPEHFNLIGSVGHQTTERNKQSPLARE